MKSVIDIDSILVPIPGENPAGEDLRYTAIYDQLKEARRADELLDLGDWKRDIKAADWDKVIAIAGDALTTKTKDLQIAAWLTEALINIDGIEGLATGLKILAGLLRDFWDWVYPIIEDGDIEFRVATLEFLNNRLGSAVKEIPLTDIRATQGYSLLKWQESRQVGYEADTVNQYGDIDESKKRRRDEMIADGKLTAESFDSALSASSKEFYESITSQIHSCREEFKRFDEMVDEKFGTQAPRLAELGTAIEECERVIMRFLKQKGGAKTTPQEAHDALAFEEKGVGEEPVGVVFTPGPSTEVQEKVLWDEAIETMRSSGITMALARLLEACYRAPSVRERSRCRLLVAKLCVKAERLDLARPIIEELYALIEELHLDRWESPMWIAEVLETLYQCLTKGKPSDEDISRAKMLFQKLCTTDVTKAIMYRT
jgi:type VI secretion system protein ImpA